MLPKVKSALIADESGNCQYSFPACYGVRHRRHKLHIFRFRASTKTHSFRCSSSPQKVFRLFGDPEDFAFPVGVLPVCLNVVFLSLPRSLTAALLCSLPSKGDHRTVISHSAGHSVVTGFRATKKAGTQMRTDSPQKDRLIPCGGGFTFM